MLLIALICTFLCSLMLAKCDYMKIVEEQNNGTVLNSLTDYLKQFVSNQSIEFRLIEDNDLSRSLLVNQKTGNVTIKGRIDRESLCDRNSIKCLMTLKFLLVPLYKTISVDMEVLDINDNTPSWPQKIIARDIIEFEATKFEDRFLSVDRAFDPDANENGSVTYSLMAADGISENVDFKIRTNSLNNARLVLYPIKVVDREKIDNYEMILLAKDNGSPRRTGTLKIKVSVIDKNDNSPIFGRQQYRNDALSETSPIGSTVLTVSASDLDAGENGKIGFRIDNDDVSKYFDIDSVGQITVKRKLDYDHGIKSFRFNVQGFDGAPEAYQKTGECEVVINLKDENDEKPVIMVHVTTKDPTTDQATIRENHVTPNFVLAHVQVKDADYGGTDRVTCSLLDNSAMMLEVSSSSDSEYQLLAVTRFDREKSSRVTAEIYCIDQARNTASKTITFQIIDENDNSPIFNKEFRFTVKENSTNPTLFVGAVRAEDLDSGDNARVSYEIEGDGKYFRIDSGGQIFTKQVLDREEIGRFYVTVLAKDNGVPQRTGTSTVIIDVVDINDWRPEFNSSVYEFTVKENDRLGTSVGFVGATDRDSSSQAAIKYRILGSYTTRLPFKIEQSNTGEIVTKYSLDREIKSSYEFFVIADDNGRPVSLTSTATVRVTVTDVNDNRPIFITNNSSKFTFQISESVGYEIGQLKAFDADSGENAVIEYQIRSENLKKYFDLNTLSGKLNLASTIVWSGEKRLIVEACDRGVPRLCSSPLWLIVKVTRAIGMESANGPYVDHQPDSKTFIIIIIGLLLLLIILILIICYFLMKSKSCVPLPRESRSNSEDAHVGDPNNTKRNMETHYHYDGQNESVLLANCQNMGPTGNLIMRNHSIDPSQQFRERQMSSDYQSIDGGSPPFRPRPIFNCDMANMQSPLNERLDPVYAGHSSFKNYYYPSPPMPFHASYSTCNVQRYRSPNYGICMTNIPRDQNFIGESLSPPRVHCQKRYSSLLNFDSALNNQDNYNYKSLRKPNPKASFV